MNTSFFCILLFVVRDVSSLRIANEKIYETIESQFYCVRRLNATHSIGCQSETSGNVGILFIVENEEHYQWVLEKGNTPPYIPAFRLSVFTKQRLLSLIHSGRISGAILLYGENDTQPDSFSPDKSCPNEGFGLYTNKYKQYSSCPWNPDNPVIDLFFEDFGIPVYLITDKHSISKMTKCFNDFNEPKNGEAEFPLCAVQLTLRMNAARDTPTCMRRNDLPYLALSDPVKHCDPLSSYNIIASLYPTSADEPVKERSIIVVASKLDSFSLFPNKAVGAYSVITSVIVLLSVAKTISKNIEKNDKNVLFVFFDGENWDYIGSSRVVYDLKRGELQPISHFNNYYKPAKLKLEHISHFIELSQIAPFSSSNESKLWVHTDPISTKSPEVEASVESLISDLESFFKPIPLNRSLNRSLPEASLQSFLKEDLGIAGVVLSSYEAEYSNKYYNSFLDVVENIADLNKTVNFLTNVATALSKTIVKMIDKKQSSNVIADENYVKLMFQCFLLTPNCSYFSDTLVPSPEEGKPFLTNTIVSAYTRNSDFWIMSPFVSAVHRLLLNYTGTVTSATSRSQCVRQMKENSSVAVEWITINVDDENSGRCVKSSSFLSEALSPAFVGDSPDWNSKTYSTWTESYFGESYARIFLVPSKRHDINILLIGIVVLLISFAATFLFNFYSSSLLSIPPRLLPQSPANC